MKEFEKYLKAHADELNKGEKSATHLWSGIEKELDKKSAMRPSKWYYAAASIIIIVMAASILFFQQDATGNEQLPLYTFSDYYGNVESEYREAIDYQMQRSGSHCGGSEEEGFSTFCDGITQLEAVYESYKVEIEEQGCNELMRDLIIDNYKRRLKLWKSLQKNVKQQKYENNYQKEERA